jgi:hypothetical protein
MADHRTPLDPSPRTLQGALAPLGAPTTITDRPLPPAVVAGAL